MKKIYITDHAMASLKTRLGCSPEKYQKIAKKAWRSHERITDGDIANRREYELQFPNTRYRKFMGWVFIFEEKHGFLILVTMYKTVRNLTSSRKSKKI